jgi:hypothetical protein
MAGFLYWFPERKNVTPAEFAKALPYAFEEGVSFDTRGVASGPDGLAGKICTTGDAAACLFKKDAQTWRKIPGTKTGEGDAERWLWVGMYNNEHMPKATDLVRKSPLPGKDVILKNGWRIHIPIALSQNPETSQFLYPLPKELRLTDDGDWQPITIEKRYEKLWIVAWEWFCSTFDFQGSAKDGKITVTYNDLFGGACEAIAANYRMKDAEADLLRCLDQTIAGNILNAVCDIELFFEGAESVKKKTEPEQALDSCNTTDGGADCTLATAQP